MLKRKLGRRSFNKIFYILCQGTVTEQKYFEYIKKKNTNSVSIHINRHNESSVLKFVKYSLSNFKEEINEADEFWLVFDKDESSNEDFNNAIAFAEKKGLKVAYSNQAFELWFIHHYKELHSPLDRRKYGIQLTKLLKFPYLKDKNTIRKVCDILYPFVGEAIKNSEKSYSQFDHNNSAIEESSTTVFKLVKSIISGNKDGK